MKKHPTKRYFPILVVFFCTLCNCKIRLNSIWMIQFLFMFINIVCKEEQQAGKSVTGSTNSDDLGEKLSPKQQYEEYLLISNKLKQQVCFKKSQRKDDYRASFAYSDGGIRCDDQKQVDKLRSVGKEMVKMIGRKILSGQFNLTKISFPIRACEPKTALYNSITCCNTFPYFMNAAASERNPLERFKIVMTCFLCTPYYLNMFAKPMNPIIGETLQATLVDGTQIYAQQISHHPPISYFLVIGPQYCYRFSGYYDFDISPGLNSLVLKNKGKRRVQFPDGTVIQGTYPKNQFSATFIGTTRIEQLGACSFVDEKNDILCNIQFDKVRKRPTDYFESVLVVNGKASEKVFGTYCGYIEFNGVRYWDGRDTSALHIELKKDIDLLPSDWSYRKDVEQFMKNPKELEYAQKCKQELQQIQRQDAKLRVKHKQAMEAELEKQAKQAEDREKQEKKMKKKKKKLEVHHNQPHAEKLSGKKQQDK